MVTVSKLLKTVYNDLTSTGPLKKLVAGVIILSAVLSFLSQKHGDLAIEEGYTPAEINICVFIQS